MATVTFDLVAFRARYPEFATLTNEQLQGCFDDATLYLNPTDTSVVVDQMTRSRLLNMLTAHIAALNYGTNGVAPNGLVGRVTGASEGSVSVSVDAAGFGAGSAWYSLTSYGLNYWQAILPYRQGRYIAACRPYYG
jgi:hypothetical protein